MAEQFLTGSIAAPGFYGLNSQESSIQLDSGFALQAYNCIIDKYGRVGSRKGWTKVNTSAASTGDFKAVFELVKEDGNVVISAANNKLYTGTSTLTEATIRNSTNSGDLSYTISDDHWQIVGMPYDTGATPSAHAVLVQANQSPLVYHKLGATAHAHTGSYGFQRLGDLATLPTGYTVDTFTPNCALSAFGRLWVADITGDRQTVYFSDLLDLTEWQTGTSGYLNISEVVPNNDPIIGLASHNGFLIIFCQRHVVIYSSPVDPSSLKLEDVISGVGCIARDSIASVAGTDIVFLSETGVQSLQRVVQEKSLPFRDISKNVRDELLQIAIVEDKKNIKAVYYPTDAFYLISFPDTGFAYCFDTRQPLGNGAARATKWSNLTPSSFCVTQDRKLYVGMTSYIGHYDGYEDNGSTYRMAYYTNYFDFSQPTSLKMLKKINVVCIGGTNQPIIFKWGFDYTFTYQSQTVTLVGASVSEYGVAEYGVAEFSTGIALENVKANIGGTGKVLQLGFETVVNGTPVSIQKIDFALKPGKNLI